MILDSSAVIAMMMAEPEGLRIEAALAKESACRLSAVSYFESSMILISRVGPDAVRDLDLVLQLLGVLIVPFTEGQARMAREAFRRYGKGRHPAALNFGDCMAYALARETGEPLLFKGTDFSQTDVAVAAY